MSELLRKAYWWAVSTPPFNNVFERMAGYISKELNVDKRRP